MKYTKVKTIRISETQHKTLVKMKSYNVDVGKFIRDAIKEKIDKEYKYLKSKTKEDSFISSLNKKLKEITPDKNSYYYIIDDCKVND